MVGDSARHIFVTNRISLFPELLQNGVHIYSVPEHDGVDDQAERVELVLLSLAVALVQFSATAMEYIAGQVVPAFVAIELYQDAPPLVFITDERQKIIGFDDAAQLLKAACQGRGLIVRLQHAHQTMGVYEAEL